MALATLITLTDIQLAYGHHPLLDHADFAIQAGERIGLIGRNGAGKSSLLRLLDGRTVPDDGDIARTSGLRVATVEQEPEPVSYTHLDVYKRQHHRKADGRSQAAWLSPSPLDACPSLEIKAVTTRSMRIRCV